ncbi:Nitric oxide-associated protein 1, partial [Dissostichus eleginoides]
MLKLLGVLRVGRGLIHGGRVLIPGGRGLSGRSGRGFRGCTVDPGQEETFVFVDFTDAELRALELQLHALGGGAFLRGGGASLQGAELLFQDVEFPGGDSAVDVSCSGCGALLHCSVAGAPGYLPGNKFKELRLEGGLGGAVCQRCHLLTHHNQALQVELSAEGYAAVVKRLRPLQGLLLLVVDLLDLPDSLPSDLISMVGDNKQIVVLGNKVDLLPGDAPNYLQRIRRQLEAYCAVAGLQVSEVQLISAKTGFGIEQLISRLQRTWSYRGDVYLSDYCKSRAADRLQRATVSPWPGTTLDLLKFPIINPTPYRIQGYLTGRVGRTFRTAPPPRDEIQFDPDSLALGEEGEGGETKAAAPPPPRQQGSEEQEGNWLYDTPGILKQHDILALLSEQEVMSVVPTQALVPRTFVLQEGASLLVGGLARIDFIKIQFSLTVSSAADRWIQFSLTVSSAADRWIQVSLTVSSAADRWIQVSLTVSSAADRWIQVSLTVSSAADRWIQVSLTVSSAADRWIQVSLTVSSAADRWIQALSP